MSSSDWNFITSSNGPFIGGISGSAVAHTSLNNAITNSGDWCRGFTTITDNTRITTAMVAKGAILSSSSGLESGYTYSLRSWIRANDNSKFLLILKGYNNFNIDYDTNWSSYWPAGYYLSIEGSNVFLVCKSTANNNSGYDSLESGDNSNPFRKYITSYSQNTWMQLRMDVVSMGVMDRITVYTGDGNNNWTSVLSPPIDIPQTKIGAYIPWNTAGRGHVGYFIGGVYTNQPVFIDKFEAYREPT